MDLTKLLQSIDTNTAQAFVTAARHVIDALLIEGERIQETQTPPTVDYENAELPRSSPAGGWLSHSELRQAAQRMAEAIAAEKWADGVLFAIRALALLGAI